MRMMLTMGLMAWGGAALAQQLAVPVIEPEGDGQAATCIGGEVFGLRAEGDGFLAIRTGPATTYARIGRLHNGDRVLIIDRQGDWVGIARDGGQTDQKGVCANAGPARRITGPDVGWVHGRWLRETAG